MGANGSATIPNWIADNVAPFFILETSPAMMRWGAGLLQTPVPIALACARAMVEEDFRAEMREIEFQPSIVLDGDRDRSAAVELTGKPSAERTPGCRLLVYEGAPHGLMFTHMDQLHAAFWSSCAKPGAQRVWPNPHREFAAALWSTSWNETGARAPLFGGARPAEPI